MADHHPPRRRQRRTSAARSLLLVACLLLPGCRLGEREMRDRTPTGCAHCHTEIVRQWQNSAHASAWTNPHFISASRNREMDQCLPCHAPEPLLDQAPGTRPRLRDYDQDFGVDCRVCHQRGCGYVGPYFSRIGPHPVEQDNIRLPCSTFCGTCHQMEEQEFTALYVPTRDAEEAPQCVGCHMPTSQARLTQGHLLSYIHPERVTHDHAFPTWTPSIAGNAVEVKDAAAQHVGRHVEVSFTLINRRAGHRIPSGKFGHRELRLVVEAIDEQGTSLGCEEQSVFPGRDGLAPGVVTPFAVGVEVGDQAAPAEVRLIVERVDRDHSFRYALAEHAWSVTRSR